MPELAAHSPSSHTTLSSSSIAGPSTQLPLSTDPSKLPKATRGTTRKPAKPTNTSKPVKEKAQPPSADDEGVEKQEGEWYAIKDIVDEKIERGVRHYLIDWCNDAVTGKSYDKSWVCCSYKRAKKICA
jgi:hypothetical protein